MKKTDRLSANPQTDSAVAALETALGLEALEPRILLDAAAVATGMDAMMILEQGQIEGDMTALFDGGEKTPSLAAPIAFAPVQDTADASVLRALGPNGMMLLDVPDDYVGQDLGLGPIAEYMDGGQMSDFEAERLEAADMLRFAQEAPEHAVFVVDMSVDGAEDIIKDLPATAYIIRIEPGQNGLDVLEERLSVMSGISELHILSHGEAGELTLGTATLTLESIAGEHADELAVIKNALAIDGDILIYGCDFGQDSAAMAALADATGADIAASTDTTGAAALGGNWVLEANMGDVQANAIVSLSFQNVLGSVPFADLNGAEPGEDSETRIQATTGNVFAIFPGEVTLVTDTGMVDSVTIDVVGAVDGASELLYHIGPLGQTAFFLDGGPQTALVTLDAAGTVQLLVTRNGTSFTITGPTGGATFAVNIETFLEQLNYGDLAPAFTEGERDLQIAVTENGLTGSVSTATIGVYNFPVAGNDVSSVAANSATPITGDLTANDNDPTPGDVLSISQVNGTDGAVGIPVQTTYGTITVQADGSYSYQVDTTNPTVAGLAAGASVTDVIAYGLQDSTGNVDTAFLTVTINGVTDLPVATDNSNSVIPQDQPSTTGNVIFDDDGAGQDSGDRPLSQLIWENEFADGQSVDGTTVTVNGVGLSFSTFDPNGIAGASNHIVSYGQNGGHDGYLVFTAGGTADPDNTPHSLTIDFDEPVTNLSFTLADIDWSQGTTWQDQFTVMGYLNGELVDLTAQVAGTVVSPSDGVFYGTGSVPASEAHGNVTILFSTPVDQVVLAYNYGPDATGRDGFQVGALSDLSWQSTGVPRVFAIDGQPADIGQPVAGTYGTFVINGDGSYTYTVDENNADVMALAPGATLTDSIPYTLIDSLDASGNTDVATLSVTITGPADHDGDGVSDLNDLDDDNDGIADVIEAGTSDPAAMTRDTDGDGIYDHLDLDSDNDGISDLEESGSGGLDANRDGVLDEMADPANDADRDGLLDSLDNGNEVVPRQTDTDGLADYLDLDSDGDGIADAIEARPTAGYVSLSDMTDSDGDGVIDTFDSVAGHGGSFDAPYVDADDTADATPDYIDTDSDGDGLTDADESGLTGLPSDVTYTDPDGTLLPGTGLTSSFGDPSEVDYRSLNTPPVLDLDDASVSPTRDYSSTYSGDPAGHPVIAADGGVFDIDSPFVGTISLDIDQASFPDGADEVLMIAGESIAIGAPGALTRTVTVNGTDYEIALSVVGGVVDMITISNPATGLIAAADAQAILQSLTYSNTASAITLGDRNIDISVAADQAGLPGTNVARATVSVAELPPIAVDDTYTLSPQSGDVTLDLLANDTDPNSDPMTITQIIDPADPANPITATVDVPITLSNGLTITPRADGTVDVAVALGATGSPTFGYITADPGGLTSDPATVTIHVDTDADGIADSVDVDDDNDGVLDVDEGFTTSGGTRHSDGDGIADHLDIDSDNDGITDNIEAQATEGYIAPSGVDANQDGLDDAYDAGLIAGGAANGQGLTPVNTDGDALADLIDPDSDNDLISDQVESGNPAATDMTDTDQDGLLDAYENGTPKDGYVVNDGVTPLDGTLPDSDGDAVSGSIVPMGADLDFRDASLAPQAIADGVFTVEPERSFTIDVLANDSDPDGNPLTVTGIYDPAAPGTLIPLMTGAPVTLTDGTIVTLLASGELTITPGTEQAAVQSLRYQIADGLGGTSEADILFRTLIDTDGDGVFDADDLDDDNDGILDTVEQTGTGTTQTALWSNDGSYDDVTGDIAAGPFVSGGGYDVLPHGTQGDVISLTSDTVPTTLAEAQAGDFYLDFTVEADGVIDLEAILLTFSEGLGDPGLLESFDIAVFTSVDDFATEIGTATRGDEVTNTITPATSIDASGVTGSDTVTVRIYLYNVTRGGVQVTDLTGDSIGIDNVTINATVYANDSDGDGKLDHRDIDADNDGITDNIEAQSTAGFIAPSGTGAAMVDSNNDGLDDRYDGTTPEGMTAGFTGIGLTPVNSDGGADNPDYLDTDSDGDGRLDIDENGLGVTGVLPTDADTDGDGLFDVFETVIDGNVDDGFNVAEGVTDVTSPPGTYLPDGGQDSTVGTPTPLINDRDFRDLNDAPDARENGYTTPESAPIAVQLITDMDAVSGTDSDPDGDSINVVAINGASFTPGTPFALPSGALITVDAAGNLTFDPNGQYEGLAVGESAVEVFTYTVADPSGELDVATVTITITGENDAPIAENDGFGGAENSVVTFNAFDDLGAGIDRDPDSDPIQITRIATGSDVTVLGALADGSGVGSAVAGSAGGIFTVAANGDVTFDPGTDFDDLAIGETRVTQIVYQIDDGQGGTDTAVMTYTVTGENDGILAVQPGDPNPPADASDFIPVQTGTDGAVFTPLDLTPYFADIDGDALTLLIDPADLPPGLSFDGTTLSGTPSADASQGGVGGVYTIPITVMDGNGAMLVTTLTIQIDNPAPTASNDAYTTPEETPITVNLVNENDSDPDGDALSVTAATLPDGTVITLGAETALPEGTIRIDATGDVTFHPAPDFNGSLTLTYVISDGQGGTNSAQAVFTVTPVNDAPVALDDIASTDQDTPATGDLLPNDTDVDGDVLSVSAVNGDPVLVGATVPGSAGGVFTLNPDGTFSFDPSGEFDTLASGDGVVTTLTYTVSDGQGGEDTAILSVTVTGTNDAPVVTGPLLTQADVDGAIVSIPTAAAFTDIDGDPITFTASGLPQGLMIDPLTGEISGQIDGSASVNGPGSDGVYTVTVTATDLDGLSVSESFTYTVTNPDPVASPDTATTAEDTPITVDVRSNDADPDGDSLTVSAVTQPAHGTVTLDPVTGNPVYTPNADFHGTDSFTYTVDDGEGGTATSTVTITVTPVNDAPVAMDDTVTTAEDTPVTIPLISNDSDVDGDALTPSVATQPAHGTVTVDSVTGEAIYTPNPDFYGTDSFTYTVDDGAGGTDTATVFITVAPVNDAPVAADDAGVTAEDTPIQIAVLANDGDVDGDGLTITAVTQPIHGTVTLDPVTGNPVYTPNADFNGTDSFTYTVDDGEGGTATATVTLTVTPVNDAPVAMNDTVTTAEDTPVTIPVRANDSDVDGDPLTVSAVTQGENGIVTINPVTGDPVYTPNADFHGIDSFTYTVDDGQGGTDTVAVTVTVDPVNDAPEVVGTPAPQMGTDATSLLPLDVSSLFSDVDGDSLTYSSPDMPDFLSIDPVTGVITGTPPADASVTGNYVVTIIATDPGGQTAEVPVAYMIVNPAPVIDLATEDQAIMDGETVSISIAASDPDGDRLTYSAVGLPDGLTIDPVTGVVSGTVDGSASQNGPALDGVYTVLVTVDDGQGGVTTDRFDITVGNPAPDAVNDDYSANENDVLTAQVITGSDSDPDGDTLTIAAVNGDPASVGQAMPGMGGGVFTLGPDGTMAFDPMSDFDDLAVGETRTTMISYVLTDGEGGTDEAVITVTVTGSNDGPVAMGPIPTQMGMDAMPLAPLDVALVFSDIDGDSLTFTLPDAPDWIVIDPVTGVISGNPPSDASTGGPDGDGVYTVTIAATDPSGAMVTETVVINIANTPVEASDDRVTLDEDGAVSGNVIAMSDGDPDGDVLTVTSLALPDGTPLAIGEPVELPEGVITLRPDGSFDFVGAPDANGTLTLVYTVTDGQGSSDSAQLVLDILPVADDPQVVTNDDGVPGEPVLGDVPVNDGEAITPIETAAAFVDVDGQVLTYRIVGGPSWLTIDPVTGVITGTAPADASTDGPITLTVVARDPDGGTASTTLNIGPVNTVPDAVSDGVIQTAEDTPIIFDPRANDADQDGDTLTITEIDGQPIAIGTPVLIDGGVVSLNTDGTLTFTPDADSSGTPSFIYTVTDGEGGTASARVDLAVDPVNDAPTVAAPLADRTGVEGAPLEPIQTADRFADIDDAALTYSVVDAPDWIVIDPITGVITGTPPNDVERSGPLTIQVVATDGSGASVATPLTLNIANPAPEAITDQLMTAEDTPLQANLLTNDRDADADALTITGVTLADGTIIPVGEAVSLPLGVLTVSADGTIDFVPTANASGDLSLSYVITDTDGATSTADATLAVTPVTDPVQITSVIDNDDATVTVTGVGDPGATLDLILPDGSVRTTQIDGNGNWSITTPSEQPNGEFGARQTLITGEDGGNDAADYLNRNTDRPIYADVDMSPRSDADHDPFGREGHWLRVSDALDDIRDRFDPVLGLAPEATPFVGDVIMTAVPGTNDAEHILIETIAREAAIDLQLSATTTGLRTVQDWVVTRERGGALPDGVEQMGDYVVIQRSLDQDSLRLRIRALLENGQAVSQIIEIDLRTAVVEPAGEATASGQTLSEQLARQVAEADRADNAPAFIRAAR